jgi:hypothetical protein
MQKGTILQDIRRKIISRESMCVDQIEKNDKKIDACRCRLRVTSVLHDARVTSAGAAVLPTLYLTVTP